MSDLSPLCAARRTTADYSGLRVHVKSAPTGKSLLIFRNAVKPRLQKYFCFLPTQISSLIRVSGLDKRGVAHVINVGPDAVDAGSALDEWC